MKQGLVLPRQPALALGVGVGIATATALIIDGL
jgi:hypothetical protein